MTNLIAQHSATDVLHQNAKHIHIFGAVQEPRRLGSLFQWDEVSENIIQFPVKSYVSDRPLTVECVGLPSESIPPLLLLLLGLTLRNRHTQ